MIRRIFTWILIIGAAVGGLYAFESTRLPCRTALAYAIGQFDARFGISLEDFRQVLGEAERPWEEALGRDLFRYDENALFPVNLVFDERQERTIESQKLEQQFSVVQSKQESIREKYDRLSALLGSARREYDVALSSFEVRLKRYNNAVAAWNESDRSDEDELESLEQEKEAIEREQGSLEAKRKKVNALVAEINSFAEEEEKIVERYNAELEEFTEVYGTGAAFDQGVYEGASINVYQFDDRDHLRMVLVHEFGHALGIGHVDNPKSIMYPMMGAQDVADLKLSSEDTAALMNTCSVTAWQLLARDFRKFWELVSA